MEHETKKYAFEQQLEEELAREAVAPPPEETAAADAPAAADAALAAMTAERDALKDQLLRLAAEFDNYRKRTAREAIELRKTAAANLLRDLLPVLDNLERALEHRGAAGEGVAAGVEMVLKQLKDALAGAGLEPIAAVGQPFDPQVHEALMQQPSELHPADTVMTEFHRGYRLGDTVLRPARVVVSSGAPEGAVETNEDSEAAAGNAGAAPAMDETN